MALLIKQMGDKNIKVFYMSQHTDNYNGRDSIMKKPS